MVNFDCRQQRGLLVGQIVRRANLFLFGDDGFNLLALGVDARLRWLLLWIVGLNNFRQIEDSVAHRIVNPITSVVGDTFNAVAPTTFRL